MDVKRILVRAVLDVTATSPLAYQQLNPLSAPLPDAFIHAALEKTRQPRNEVLFVIASAMKQFNADPRFKGVVVSACIAPFEFFALLVRAATQPDAARGTGSVRVPLGCCTNPDCDVVAFNTCCWNTLMGWCDTGFATDFFAESEGLWNVVRFMDERSNLGPVLQALVEWLRAINMGSTSSAPPKHLADAERRLRHERCNTFLFAAPWTEDMGHMHGQKCVSIWNASYNPLKQLEQEELEFFLEASTEPRERAFAYAATVGAAQDVDVNLERLGHTGVRVVV
jgi:hypothetical protein